MKPFSCSVGKVWEGPMESVQENRSQKEGVNEGETQEQQQRSDVRQREIIKKK